MFFARRAERIPRDARKSALLGMRGRINPHGVGRGDNCHPHGEERILRVSNHEPRYIFILRDAAAPSLPSSREESVAAQNNLDLGLHLRLLFAREAEVFLDLIGCKGTVEHCLCEASLRCLSICAV